MWRALPLLVASLSFHYPIYFRGRLMQQARQESHSFIEQSGLTRPIRVALAEDHMLTRIGLRHSLKKYAQIEIIAEAEDGQEIIGIAETSHPDLILMDLSMPVMDGI